MPTPFMHLEMAENIRSNSLLPRDIKQCLEEHFPAFYLGNVAPDVQSVADIGREETHFYQLPPALDDLGYQTMLERYPEIANGSTLSAGQAVFIAGYCAHLMLDLRWYHDVLIPFFVEQENWTSLREAFIVHNTLLTYLDKSAVAALPADAGDTLASSRPDHWLPFANDDDLVKWRDQLVEQLRPGSLLMTVEVYAKRLGISPDEFAANLEMQSWMDEHLFNKVPVDKVLGIMHSAIDESVAIIDGYLS